MPERKRPGRPKGGMGFRTKSLSLTEKQIRWLDATPNASAKLRELIDMLMDWDSLPAEYVRVKLLGKKLVILQERLDGLIEDRRAKGSEMTWGPKIRNFKIYELDVNNPRDPLTLEPVNQEGVMMLSEYRAINEAVIQVEEEIKKVKDDYSNTGK